MKQLSFLLGIPLLLSSPLAHAACSDESLNRASELVSRKVKHFELQLKTEQSIEEDYRKLGLGMDIKNLRNRRKLWI
jgi:hypothetical protein